MEFKVFADDKSNLAKMISVCYRVENIVGKGENAGYQHFLLFPQCFQKTSPCAGLLKVRTVWESVKSFIPFKIDLYRYSFGYSKETVKTILEKSGQVRILPDSIYLNLEQTPTPPPPPHTHTHTHTLRIFQASPKFEIYVCSL